MALAVAAAALLATIAVVIAAAVAWPTLSAQGRKVADARDHHAAGHGSAAVAEPHQDRHQDRHQDGHPDRKVRKPPAAQPAVGAANTAPATEATRGGGATMPPNATMPEPNEGREATMPTEPAAAEDPAAAEAARERLRAEALPLVEKSLRQALSAIRDGDEPAARRAVDAAVQAAGEDGELVTRCERWRLLVNYAKELETYRRQASESAAKGREYEIGGRTIGIVELTPRNYAYKEAGRLVRGARSDLPKPIERAILRAWFAGDGRAANHIFLGIDLLLDPTPDLQRVRAEWETALAGEPATQSLMPLLDDRVLAGR